MQRGNLNFRNYVDEFISGDILVFVDRVVVNKLFNLFDYDITFKNDKNVSIFIAPNGCGKTTIFNFLEFFSNPNEDTFENIKHIPYESFTCYYSNGTEVSLITNKEDVYECDFYNKTFQIKNKMFDIDESLNIYSCYKNSYYDYNMAKNMEKNFCKKINDLKYHLVPYLDYISANRLPLDNFKRFLKENKSSNSYNVGDLNSCLYNKSNLKEIVDEVIGGFNYIEELSSRDDEEDKQDAKELLDKLNEKMNLFIEIFNRRNRLTKKEIVFSKEFGVQIYQKGKEIPINCLSTGEKNDFIVFYNLIFSSIGYFSHGMIIDEPEISLHIQWQKEYVDDVLKILEMKARQGSVFQVIIATHSPSIINGHFDLYAEKKVTVYD